MIVSKELEWMRPYIDEALKILPKGVTVTRLATWKINGRYGKDLFAAIITNDMKTFRIYLHTHCHPRHLKTPRKFTKNELIKTLAHELAHVPDMAHHHPAHTKIEGKLYVKFSELLKASGYISEEHEEASTK